MCGRSIRVPLLDGSVEPLPDPKLNLEDHGLASALDKLAALVSSDPKQQVADEEEPRRAPAKGVLEEAPKPVPLPEPITLEPAPVPVPIVPEPPPVPATSAPKPAAPADGKVLDSLAAAAGTSSPATSARRSPGHHHEINRWPTVIGGILLAAVSFVAGYSVGHRSSEEQDNEVASSESPPDVAGPNPVAPAPLAGGTPALSGRIQYVDSAGESRPDVRARVLVLPEERSGTSKLATDGFRAGADPADLQLAVASVRALGGDFALTAEDGSYEISVPQPGLYQLVILSRYQPRPESLPADPSAIQFLGTYFDRPAQITGDAALLISPFRYRGTEPSQRDHSFEAP